MSTNPPTFSPFVIDISHWIDVPDFNLISPRPWLVLTKATEGDYMYDSQYASYANEIRDAGYRLGAYHFMRPGDEISQADWFCEIVYTVGLQGNEVLALDLEVSEISLDQCRRFMDRVQHVLGIRPILYSTELIIESLYLTPNQPPEWLKNEWLWIAEYATANGSIPDWIVPAGLSKSKIALWQYTDDGVVSGIPNNNVDLNIISSGFVNHIGLTEPEEASTMRYRMTTINNGTRIRTDHNTAGAILASVNGGVTVEGDELFTATEQLSNSSGVYQKVNDQWLHVTHQGVVGWMAHTHLGSLICRDFVDTEEPTEPPIESRIVSITIAEDGWETVTVNVSQPKHAG